MPDETKKPKRTRHSKPDNLANSEIDKRLAQAIVDRAKALQMCSKLAYWQDRLQRVTQEIDSLINFQQRLLGKEIMTISAAPSPIEVHAPSAFSHLADISGAGSIPTPPRQPKPTHGNVVEKVIDEGGFS